MPSPFRCAPGGKRSCQNHEAYQSPAHCVKLLFRHLVLPDQTDLPQNCSPAMARMQIVECNAIAATQSSTPALSLGKNMLSPPARDRELVRIVDKALAATALRSGPWLACRPGCTQCCIGVFPINQLDSVRLRQGLRDLEAADPVRAARVRTRARDAVARLSHDFPGDPATGVLDRGPHAEEAFAAFADEEPCPALDPETGLCDLYESRPMTCRVFGPTRPLPGRPRRLRVVLSGRNRQADCRLRDDAGSA